MESILRWLQSLVRTTSPSDESETGQDLFLDARTTSEQLGLRGYVLCSQRSSPTALAPATARIRASQAGHWPCARRGRDPAQSQSHRRSRRCVRGSAAIAECPPFSCFRSGERHVDVFLFCGEKQEPKMAPFHFWHKNNPKSKSGFSCLWFVVNGKFLRPQNGGSLKLVPLLFCGLRLAPQTYIPPPGRSMRTVQGVHLVL